ncbi:MAG: response regulator [Myxococcota bacterium]
MGLGRVREAARGVVLLVEDDVNLRDITRDALQEAGYTVRVVNTLDDAVPELANNTVDVIVVDVGKPGMRTGPFMAALRSLRAHENTPVVAWSASPTLAEYAREFGDTGLLHTPATLSGLITVLGRHVARG